MLVNGINFIFTLNSHIDFAGCNMVECGDSGDVIQQNIQGVQEQVKSSKSANKNIICMFVMGNFLGNAIGKQQMQIDDGKDILPFHFYLNIKEN